MRFASQNLAVEKPVKEAVSFPYRAMVLVCLLAVLIFLAGCEQFRRETAKLNARERAEEVPAVTPVATPSNLLTRPVDPAGEVER